MGRRRAPRVRFLVCGTQKGGTSALYEHLKQHPEIYMPERKELHFFDADHFRRSWVGDSRYHASFRHALAGQLCGEATPSYMYWQDAPRRIWEYNPHMKLLLVLRNPIERAFSHWHMERVKGRETLSFSDAIHSERDRCRRALPLQDPFRSYVDRGFYLEQLRRIWRHFPEDQVLVLRHEELRNELRRALGAVSTFLGISEWRDVVKRDVHSQTYEVTLQRRDRQYLAHLYRYEILGLEQELGWDCQNWLLS